MTWFSLRLPGRSRVPPHRMDQLHCACTTQIQADEPVPFRRVKELVTPFFDACSERGRHGNTCEGLTQVVVGRFD